MSRMNAPGFTLMEVLAAVFLTSIVITVAVGFYINLSNSSQYATQTLRQQRRATVVLDRIGRDLQSAVMLVKPDELDPLDHPWVFRAGARYSTDGADRIEFVTRNHRPRVSAYHASDLALVSYFVSAEGNGYTLYRWLMPSLPSEPDEFFPEPEDERSFVLAEDLHSFSLRFRDAEGEWLDEWDASTQVHSSELPREIEIELSFLAESDTDAALGEPRSYGLRVALQIPPLDLAAMIDSASGGGSADGSEEDEESEDEEGGDSPKAKMSVGECVRANMDACTSAFGEALCGSLVGESLPISEVGVAIPESWQCQ